MTDPITPDSEISTRLSKLKSIQSITDGRVRYERRWTDCGNKRCHRCTDQITGQRRASHGPYWYMIALDQVTKRRRTIYLGDKLDTTLYRTKEGGFDHAQHQHRHAPREQTAQTPEGPSPMGERSQPYEGEIERTPNEQPQLDSTTTETPDTPTRT